jgi:hypothetical protein
MPKELAVFRGRDGTAVVLNVLSVVGGSIMYVTDNKGFIEYKSGGSTRRFLAMSRSVAYRFDPAKVAHGNSPNWNELRNY